MTINGRGTLYIDLDEHRWLSVDLGTYYGKDKSVFLIMANGEVRCSMWLSYSDFNGLVSFLDGLCRFTSG